MKLMLVSIQLCTVGAFNFRWIENQNSSILQLNLLNLNWTMPASNYVKFLNWLHVFLEIKIMMLEALLGSEFNDEIHIMQK